MLAKNSISLTGLLISALVTPLVPPILISAGIFSYSAVGAIFADNPAELRRAVDITLFLMLVVITYGSLISYIAMAVFFLPLHGVLWVGGLGGHMPYAAAGALSSGLITLLGLADPAMRNGYLEVFFILCGASAGVFFWKLASTVRPLSDAEMAKPNPLKVRLTAATRRVFNPRPL